MYTARWVCKWLYFKSCRGKELRFAECVLRCPRAFLTWRDSKSCVFSSLAGACTRTGSSARVLLSHNLKPGSGTCVLVSGSDLLKAISCCSSSFTRVVSSVRALVCEVLVFLMLFFLRSSPIWHLIPPLEERFEGESPPDWYLPQNRNTVKCQHLFFPFPPGYPCFRRVLLHS